MIGFLGKYKKVFGIFGLLLVICGFTAAMAPDSFLKPANIENTVRWTALFGIISVGVAFVIMTGGIDLSIGSVVGLIGCILAMLLSTTYAPLDAYSVNEVDQGARKIVISGDAEFVAGDSVSFLDHFYTVESVTNNELVVAEKLETSDASGTLLRVCKINALGDEGSEVVRRGSVPMKLRRIVLQGELDAVGPEDRLLLMPEIGLPQELTIHRAQVEAGETLLDVYVRAGQRIRETTFASVSLRSQYMATPMAILSALGVSLLIGLIHGLLITKGQLQPFVVTLCGLLIYRGLARYLTGDQEQGFGSEYPSLKEYAKGDFFQIFTGQELAFDIPMPFVYLTIVSVVAAIFLNKTIFGRYILALGRNEDAARYSGINTDRMVIVAYMICSFCGGLAAILFALDLNSIQPSGHGEFYELYAIAAAVLGGCSLRGGEGSILGVVIAAAVMRVLNNAINLIDGIDTSTEFAIIGFVILLGVTADETIRRIAARRRATAGKT